MLPNRVSNPGPLTYESGALPIALRGPAQRIELLNAVSQYQTPSLSLLLYGNDSFSLGTNTVIFEKVHKFIMDSKRF